MCIQFCKARGSKFGGFNFYEKSTQPQNHRGTIGEPGVKGDKAE